ncbi:PTS sugar transporter subunit IIA [Akkermansiaceae bacterium]|nr:PTS sugar transporter subunit IIA [Akkermansiaceae bacterium]
MSALQKLVTPESVILELTETDHEEVVLEMVGHLCKIGKVSSGDCYCVGNAVLERESHIGTGLGSGVAIPHARVKGLKETLAVFGRSREGVDFDCPDNAPSLSELNLKEPGRDATRNFKNGDIRFAACLGEAPGPYFPAVPQTRWQFIRDEDDYWMIKGTSDAIESKYHEALIERSVLYASNYNRRLLKLLK